MGRLMEAELCDVELGIVFAVSHGRVFDQWHWMRTRECPTLVFPTERQCDRACNDLWNPERALWVRQIPALALSSREATVLVVDVWGDCRFAGLRAASGAQHLRVGTPLGSVVDRAMTPPKRYRGKPPVTEVIDIGPTGITPLVRGTSLLSWASRHGINDRFYWEQEQRDTGFHKYNRAGLYGIVETFERVNEPEDRFYAQKLVTDSRELARVRAGAQAHDYIDRGLGDIEAFLREQG